MVTITTSNKNTVSRSILSSRFIWNNDNNVPQARVKGSQAAQAIEHVKRKVDTGEYVFEHVPCFCGARDDVLISEVDRHGLYYPLVICTHCGLMYANPRMNKESFIQFYTHEYRTVYGEGDKDLDALYERRIQQGKDKYAFFMQSVDIPPHGVIFEMGCDFGTMLLPFAEAGYDVYGCDYGVEHIEHGRAKLGLNNLFVGGPEELSKTGKKADFIILNHVVEHFLDLEESLHHIHNMLKPDGMCYIGLPGLYGRVQNRLTGNNNILPLLQNAHTYQFTLATLRYVMECCGFELLQGDETIEAFFKYSNHYRGKEERCVDAYSNELTYLQKTEKKFICKRAIGATLDRLGVKSLIKNMLKKSARGNQ